MNQELITRIRVYTSIETIVSIENIPDLKMITFLEQVKYISVKNIQYKYSFIYINYNI